MEFTKKEKIEFKDIVVETIKKIGEKALIEFNGGYWKKEVKGNFIEETYVPDSRKEYIQGIEFLSDLIIPEMKHKKYGGEMAEDYEKITKEVESLLKKLEAQTIEQEEYTIKKTRLMRQLFQRLMIFCYDIKYFKKETRTA